MENCKWNYKTTADPVLMAELVKKSSLDKDIVSILCSRGINSVEKIEKFLNPSLENISDPFLFEDMSRTIERIIDAMNKKEKICVYGDYDVDGITSTTLFYLAMKNLGILVDYYIPLREEGYGININALEKLAANGCKLLVTVDCGISSNKEVDYATKLGIDTIITDHHEITGVVPDAYAIINPKRDENKYQFRYLAGVGTIFMVLMALYKTLNRLEELFDFLDIVAIGTVADIVPLTDENRIFVKHGINLMKNSKNRGLKTLLSLLFENSISKDFTTYDIGFRIAPVFNAAGRLEDAKKAVELLISEDDFEIRQISQYLKNMNTERQDIEKSIIVKVEKAIEDKELQLMNIIIAADASFHHGVIGIAASKITDKYYKPSIILENKPDGTSVGSARSIESFNIIKALTSMKELFVKFGGHESAAGFTIHTKDLDIFSERINDYAKTVLKIEDFIRPIKIEKEIPLFKASLEFFYEIEKLSPFGFGNANPIFSSTNVDIINARIVGKDETHLMFDIKKDNIIVKNCMWFNKAKHYEDVIKNKHFDIAFKLDLNFFNDRYSAKILVEDVNFSTKPGNSIVKYLEMYDTTFPIKTIFYSKSQSIEDKVEFYIDFENYFNSLVIRQGHKTVSTLSPELSYVLYTLYNNYGFNFKIKFIKKERTDSNYQITVEIIRDMSFNTYSFNDSSIFKDIKEFLIDEFDYNHMQKHVLKKLFHEKQNLILISKRGRGIKTICLTIALFHFHKSKIKSLFVTDEYISEPFIREYFDIVSPSEIGNTSKYPFAVFYNCKSFEKLNPNLNFFFFEEDVEAPVNIEKYVDNFKIQKNITIIDELELEHCIKNNKNVFCRKLPHHEKNLFVNKINSGEQIFATRDILSLI